jgi:hypothetical protein
MQVDAEKYARMYPSMNISKMVPCSTKSRSEATNVKINQGK